MGVNQQNKSVFFWHENLRDFMGVYQENMV